MDDTEIIALYHRRSERAIAETDGKYGPYCRGIARNLLSIREDAEECVSDTWYAAWTRMPPRAAPIPAGVFGAHYPEPVHQPISLQPGAEALQRHGGAVVRAGRLRSRSP